MTVQATDNRKPRAKISAWVTPEFSARMQIAADAAGCSISELLRAGAVAYVDAIEKGIADPGNTEGAT
jgi:hypothetical protein